MKRAVGLRIKSCQPVGPPSLPFKPVQLLPFPRPIQLLLAGGACLVAAGCRTYNDDIAPLVDPYSAGNFQVAAAVVHSEEFQRHYLSKSDGLLFLLEGGKVLFDAGEYDASAALFDRAAERLTEYDNAADVSISEELAASVGTQASRAYRGTDYDRILLELYQAFNELGRGDLGEALVRTRRIYRRQAEAVARNAAEIEAREEKGDAAGQAALDSENYQQFNQSLEAIKGEAYADFVNPMGTFLSALLLREEGSQADSRVDLQRLIDLRPDNRWLPDLLKEFEGSSEPTPDRLYVVFENGMAPMRWQFSLLLPTPNGITRFAVPNLKTMPRDVGHLRVQGAAGALDLVTQEIASVDSIVATEFQATLATDIWRMVVSQVAKQFVSNAVQRDDDYGLLYLFTAIYRLLSSDADLRTWRTLGAEFQIAYGQVPEDGLVKLSYPGHLATPVQVRIPPARTTILFVRNPRVSPIVPRVFSIGVRGAVRAAAKAASPPSRELDTPASLLSDLAESLDPSSTVLSRTEES